MRVVVYGWEASPIRQGLAGLSLMCPEEQEEVTGLFYKSLKPEHVPDRHWGQFVDHYPSVVHKGHELRGHITEVCYMSGS